MERLSGKPMVPIGIGIGYWRIIGLDDGLTTDESDEWTGHRITSDPDEFNLKPMLSGLADGWKKLRIT